MLFHINATLLTKRKCIGVLAKIATRQALVGSRVKPGWKVCPAHAEYFFPVRRCTPRYTMDKISHRIVRQEYYIPT